MEIPVRCCSSVAVDVEQFGHKQHLAVAKEEVQRQQEQVAQLTLLALYHSGQLAQQVLPMWGANRVQRLPLPMSWR
jgi:trehalose utilization protein